MEKTKTGIPGLDQLIGGGFPADSVVLVSGSPGTGKTILSLQFIAQGCKNHNERGLYISFEEREDKIREQAKQFGWDFAALEKRGKLKLLTISKLSFGQMYGRINKTINEFKPSRLVIDSLTYFTLAAHNRKEMGDLSNAATDEIIYGEAQPSYALQWDSIMVRKTLTDLVGKLQTGRICTLMTSETSKSGEWYSRDTLSEFICDGILQMKATSIGSDMQRTIEIVKLRNAKIDGGTYSFEFKKNGIKISEQ